MRDSQIDDDADERWAELSARANLTTALLARSEANVARQLGEVGIRDAEIKRLDAEVRSRDAEIKRLHAEVRNRDAEIERLHREVQNRDAEIERVVELHRKILASTSWRLTAPARSLISWINSTSRVNR